MDFKDDCNIMGLERDASQDEIKRSYRNLARQYHPNVSIEVDAEALFRELGKAVKILADSVVNT